MYVFDQISISGEILFVTTSKGSKTTIRMKKLSAGKKLSRKLADGRQTLTVNSLGRNNSRA